MDQMKYSSATTKRMIHVHNPKRDPTHSPSQKAQQICTQTKPITFPPQQQQTQQNQVKKRNQILPFK
jgi:hypothetical protein